ncbi:MAG TPA: TIR domain-containing protein [Thermoanaerobaculia bacterium]|nr:TIR domain-containing protein [Thermoanaerobaculia bacterium]
MALVRYDVFLCHNSREKESAACLETKLRNEGLRIFLDDRALVAGVSLPAEIPTALTESLSFALLLGPSGLGKWQSFEIDNAISRAIEDPAYRIIVLMLAGANLGELPPSLFHFLRVDFSAGLNDSEAFRRLVDGVRGSLSLDSAGVSIDLPYRSMAPRSESFVRRPELEAVVEALTHEPEEGDHVPMAVALTTALRGAGGFGKTALAQAVCEHEAVRRRFPAGILWITLGEAQRLARVRDLLRWWTRREPSSYETLEAAAGFLRESLSGQRVLLVLDDVWLMADVAPFAGMGSPAALLITTRNTRALPTATYAVVVDALELPRAVELLGQGLSPLPQMSVLARLAGRLGEWPILLKLVNAQLREEYRNGVAAEEAFRIVESALSEMRLTAFDREDEEARELAVRRTVEASLQRLSSEDRQRYARLAVFPEDEHVPLAVLKLLWDVGEEEVSRVCRRLAEMSLLYRFDRVGHWIQLHDVMRAYLLREHREMMPSFQGFFVDAYLQAAEGSRREVEPYFVARLPYHLKEGGRERDLEDLLFSYAWLEKKLSGGDVNAAMADYELLPSLTEAAAIREGLLLSRSILTEDPSQLASQLHGRLVGSSSERIRNLLNDAIASHIRPWLRPLTATLRKPSDPLTFAFQAHQGEIRAIVQLDENRFATAGTDGEIHVWDFATGEQIVALGAAVRPIRHLAAVTPSRLLAASDDGVIRLWDLDKEKVIQSFEEHHSPITALRLRHEEFLSGAEDGTMLRWSLNSDKPLTFFQGHPSKINGIGYLDSRTMVSIGKDQTLRVWNIPSGAQLKVLTLPVFAAQVLEVTASNEVILGTFGGEVQVWKPLSRETQPRRSFRYPSVGMDALCLLERDLGVSAEGFSSEIQLWNPRTGALGPKIHVPGGGVSALVRFGSDHLLCGSKDGRFSVWAIEALRSRVTENPTGSVYAVAALDSTTAVSASPDGSLKIWDALEGALLRTFEGHSGFVSSICTLDSDRIASSSSSENIIRIWNPRTGKLLNTIQSQQRTGALAAFGSDFLFAAPADPLAKDQSIQTWHLALGQKMSDLPAFPGGVATLCAVDSRFLLIGTYDGLIVHLDISTEFNRRNFALRGHEKGVFSLAIIDRGHLASGSLDQTIRIWDLGSQETVQILRGHKGVVTGLASISSRFLVSASQDQTIRVWNLETGTPIVNLHLDTGLSSLAVMPDGRTLVAGDAAGTMHFLRLEGLVA